MMNSRGGPQQPPGGGGGASPGGGAGVGDHQSPLSLLVNAADSRGDRGGGAGGPPGNPGQGGVGGGPSHAAMMEALRRGEGGGGGGGPGGGGGFSLEEQFLLQQQLQGQLGGAHVGGLLGQLQQQQQLASLLGFGGGGGAPGASPSDVQMALAHQLRQQQHAQQQQQQQQQPFSQADLLALSRSGALGGLSGLLGGGGPPPGLAGLGAHFGAPSLGDYDGIQRLEELERRSRLLGAGGAGPSGLPAPSRALSSGVPGGDSMADTAERTESSSPKPKQPGDPSRGIRPGAAAAAASSRGAHLKIGKSTKTTIPSSALQSSGGAGADAASTDEKDDLEKAPGSVIVPCRARGMPMDHNFKTAYFVIPENVKHGEELICSYFACRNAGIKFRYCSHCKVPVAKRNFRKRHKHGGEDVGNLPGDDSDDDLADVATMPPSATAKKPSSSGGIPSQITAGRKEEADADGISSQSADSDQGKAKGAVAAAARKAAAAAAAARKPLITTSKSVANKTDGKIESDRRKRWMELLETRPSTKQGDSMSTWLMEVLAVSDLETPLLPGEVLGTGSASDEAKAKSAIAAAVKASNAGKKETGGGDAGDTTSTDEDSNDFDKDRANGGSKKRTAPGDDEEEGKDPADVGGEGDSEFFVQGSFAAWKERKKAKKQAKLDAQLPVPPTKDEAA